MADQFPGKPVNFRAFESVTLIALKIEDCRTTHGPDVDAIAIEYVVLHDRSPVYAQRICAHWSHPTRVIWGVAIHCEASRGRWDKSDLSELVLRRSPRISCISGFGARIRVFPVQSATRPCRPRTPDSADVRLHWAKACW